MVITGVFSTRVLGMMLACASLLIGISTQTSTAQVLFSGRVIDMDTGKGISRATIEILGKQAGASSDSSGLFSLPLSKPSQRVEIRCLGYVSQQFVVLADSSEQAFYLKSTAQRIEEVTIVNKGKKRKLKEPALELIENVIAHKAVNKVQNAESVQYKEYEKLQFGLVDPSKSYLSKAAILKFFFENVDSTTYEGKKISFYPL